MKNKKVKFILPALTTSVTLFASCSSLIFTSCKNDKKTIEELRAYAKNLTYVPTEGTQIDKNQNIQDPTFLAQVKNWNPENKVDGVGLYKTEIVSIDDKKDNASGQTFLLLKVKITDTDKKVSVEEYVWSDITNYLKDNTPIPPKPTPDPGIGEADKTRILEELNNIKEAINFTFKKEPADTLPSAITKNDINVSGLDESKASIQFLKLEANNKNGSLKISYRLISKEQKSLVIDDEQEFEGFKKQENNPIPNPNPGPNPDPTPNPGPAPEPNPSPDGGYKYKIRLAHWNVCNYGDTGFKQNTAKGQAIASIIYNQKYDVCGLTELDSVNVPHRLADLLNEIERKKGTNNVWKAIVGDYKNESGEAGAQAGSGDRAAAYLYKSNIVKPVAFKNGAIGQFYKNKYFENKFGTSGSLGSEYKRPPYVVKFQSLVKNVENANFTFAISHFDGPGTKAAGEGASGLGAGVGSCEANEAWNIKNVFKWMSEEAEDDDLVFQGDTNIPLNKARGAFGDDVEDKWSLLKDTSENASSLRTTEGNYAQPYDKILHYSNLKASNAKVYKLWNFVNENIFHWATINSLSEWYQYTKTVNTKTANSAARSLYGGGGVSDHCPVSYDLELDSKDPR